MSDQNFQSYKVWDRGTRIFHWVNVLCILTLVVIGTIILNGKLFGFSTEGKVFIKTVHVCVGYIFVLNLAWRLIWGFIGGPNARWKAILPAGKGYMARLKAYIAGEKSGDPQYYKGHNPVGRIAVTLMFILCISQAVTGLVVAGTDIYFPPFGHMIQEWVAASGIDPVSLIAGNKDMVDPEAYKEMRAFRKPYINLHVIGYYALIVMVILHIFAVIRTEVKHGGGIISAMFTGKKVLPKDPVDK